MKTVLICEDEPFIAADLEEMIYSADYLPIGTARSFAEALEIADAKRPDVAIVDINLSDGATGAKVARLLAKGGTRIIVLSSETDVMPDLAGIPHTYLTKPVNPAVMTEILAFGSGRASVIAPRAPAVSPSAFPLSV